MNKQGALFLIVLAAGLLGAQEPQALTNGDILALVKAGVGSQVVPSKIERSPGRFDTSPAALVELKAAGVPDDVLMAMLKVSPVIGPSRSNSKEAIPRVTVQKTLQDCGQLIAADVEIKDRVSANGQYNLGVRYYKGLGLPVDYGKAVTWFRRAAEQGCAAAQYSLGVMFDNGKGVVQDFGEAADWYGKAADQGYDDSQNALGVTPKHEPLVSDLPARNGAEAGDPAAQEELANAFFYGISVPKDYVQAHKWANLATTLAPIEQQAKYADFRDGIPIAGKMSAQQVAEAQKLAREWMEAFERRTRGEQEPTSPSVPDRNGFAAPGEESKVATRGVDTTRERGSIIRWTPPSGKPIRGQPASTQTEFLIAGKTVRQIETRALAVRVVLESADDPLRVVVVVVNKGSDPFDVFPEAFTLNVVEPKERAGVLTYLSPEAVAKKIARAATWMAIAEGLASGARSIQGTSTTSSSGNVAATTPTGRIIGYGTYNGVVTTHDNVLNQQVTAQNLAKIADASEARKVRETTGALLPNTMFPGTTYGGVLHFKRETDARLMTFRASVAGEVFEFPLEMPRR